MKAAPRALLLPGPMNHACIQDAVVMRLKGAGCLTCESETTAGVGRTHRRHPEARAKLANPESTVLTVKQCMPPSKVGQT